MQYVRSLIFNLQIYVAMLVLAVVFFPMALFSRDWALRACHTWCRWVVWTASWIGCVPVDRGKRGRAVAQMVAQVNPGLRRPGQLIIYPQGTRIPPGVTAPYKIGAGVLYEGLGQPCVPVATSNGTS